MTPSHDRERKAVLDAIVVADHGRSTSDAFLSLANAQRRLAHRAKSEAARWEAEGHRPNYLACRLESDRLWRSAKFNLRQARMWRKQ